MNNWHVWQTREYARKQVSAYKEMREWAETPIELAMINSTLGRLLDLYEACWSAMRDDERLEEREMQ